MKRMPEGTKVEEGKMYLIEEIFENHVVTLKKNSLPYYKFSADKCWKIKEDGTLEEETNSGYYKEVWTEEGIAHHFDCNLNLTQEYIP